MNKEKQIEEMMSHIYYKGESQKIACEQLVNAGYGNVKQAVKEFIGELKTMFVKRYRTVTRDRIYEFTDIQIDSLFKELYDGKETEISDEIYDKAEELAETELCKVKCLCPDLKEVAICCQCEVFTSLRQYYVEKLKVKKVEA